MTPYRHAMHFIDHIVPFVLVLVDYILNRVPFQMRHMIIVAILQVVYMGCNIAGSFIRGYPIYKPLDPETPMFYVLSVCLMGFSTLWFFGYVYLTRWKLRKYAGMDRLNSFKKVVSKDDNDEILMEGPYVPRI